MGIIIVFGIVIFFCSVWIILRYKRIHNFKRIVGVYPKDPFAMEKLKEFIVANPGSINKMESLAKKCGLLKPRVVG